MNAADLFGVVAALLVGIGLYGLIVNPQPLRKILSFNVIGNGVFVGRNTILSCKNGDIVIEDDANLGFNCEIFSASRVRVGKSILMAAYTYLVGGDHLYDRIDIPVLQQGRTARDVAVGDALHLEGVEAAELGDLVEGQRGVVDQPDGGRARHDRLVHRSAPLQISPGPGKRLRAGPASSTMSGNQRRYTAIPGEGKVKMRCVLAILAAILAGPAAGDGEKAGDFDYYVMSLSWSAAWCALEGDARDDPQCDVGRGLTFVLHGLWPQHEAGWPQYCRPDAIPGL